MHEEQMVKITKVLIMFLMPEIHNTGNYFWCMETAMGIGEHTSSAIFLPSSTEDFLKSEPLARVFFETVLGEWSNITQSLSEQRHAIDGPS